MDVSIFLAKVLGLYMLVMSTTILRNPARFKSIVTDIDGSPALLMLSGILPLIVGSLLVVSHPFWTLDWRLLITLFGWLVFLNGTIRALFPKIALRFDTRFLKKSKSLQITAVVILALGIFFCFMGFVYQ